MTNIKEKVLKDDYRIEFLRKLIKIEKTKQEGTTITLDYINSLESKLSLLLSTKKHYLAEVGKVIDELRKETYFGKVPSVVERSLKLAILEKIKKELGIK